MIRIAAWCHRWDDSFLRLVAQLGVDCLDHVPVPHVPGEGYPDLDKLLDIRKQVRSWGMDWNRLSLPILSEQFMRGEEGFEAELEPVVKTMQVYAEAGVPIIRAAFAKDRFPWMNRHYETTHRGGYVYGGQSLNHLEDTSGPPRRRRRSKRGGSNSVSLMSAWCRSPRSTIRSSSCNPLIAPTRTPLLAGSDFIALSMRSPVAL